MTTLTTGPHSTSTIAWRFTTCTSTNSSTERAHEVFHFLCTFHHTHIWLKFFAPFHASSTCHPCVRLLHLDLHSLLPRSSSCLSSSSPSSTSATSSSRSSTRSSWKTCTTPPTTGVRTHTTSSTSPHYAKGNLRKSY